MKTETIQIDGMSCGHCVRAVREALEETDGVTVEHVEIGTATVRYEGDRSRLVEAVEDAGYAVPESA
ncbi:MAG: heavy-metal-associated domain-containing protein [Rhodothermales bacterium]|nr:heavy-metal-associated domain-containing protein [Rhodothermales bacterium]